MSRWIGVAVLDWSGDDFADFYPEDVPEDWQLTWLANLAMAVVISPEKWRGASESQVKDWVGQTQENFWFYLLCETSEDILTAEVVAGYFPQQFGGMVCSHQVQEYQKSYDFLTLGSEVLVYQSDTLRQGRKQVSAWLDQFQAEHGLILLTGKMRKQVKDIQSLLALLGITNE